MPESLEIRSAAERFHTDLGWLDSSHCFSFGEHHDPANVGHGLLVVSNDDVVAPGAGFGTHAHRDMEIVTWVLEGELEHRDSTGATGVIYPGLAQRMSAGSGIQHSEMNHSQTASVHFLRMWVLPDTPSVAPGYAQRDLNARLDTGGPVAVASGRGHPDAVDLRQRDAVLWVGRLGVSDEMAVPVAPHVHVYVAVGAVELDGHSLAVGDAARLTGGVAVSLRAITRSEVVIWETA